MVLRCSTRDGVIVKYSNNKMPGSPEPNARCDTLEGTSETKEDINFKMENDPEPPSDLSFVSPTAKWSSLGPIYRHRRTIAHLIIFLLFTGWWITSLILHRHDKNWVVPFLIWICVILRLVFFRLPIHHVTNAIQWVWTQSAVRIYDAVPEKYHSIAGILLTSCIVVVGSFIPQEDGENTRANRAVSLFGMLVIFSCFYASSKHRDYVRWRTISAGILGQYIIGLIVLRTSVGYNIFKFIADRVADLFEFSEQGLIFLTQPSITDLGWFILTVIPALIFFISLVQVLFYIGFIQWFIGKLAAFVNWSLGVSGAEAIVAAATPFIGQGESVMLVRPFIAYMTKAEIHQVMTCGFATISGAVLIGYIQLGLNAQVLVSSCVMSIPASIAVSKLRYPETEETLTKSSSSVPDDEEHKAQNWLHAFANGQWLGIKVGATIVASLLCVLGFVALVNGLLSWWGSYLNINDPELTLQTILGYALYPVAFLLGVPRNGNLLRLSKLIAEKIITVSYISRLRQIA